MSDSTSRLGSFLELAGSVRLGVVLLMLLALSSVLGTVILQETLPGGDPLEAADYYGDAAHRVLQTLRLTDVFHAPWYHALMGLLALNILCATIAHFSLRAEKWGFLLAHAGVLLTLWGGLVYFARGDKGVLVLAEGDTTDRYISRRGRSYRSLPFTVRLDRFAIEHYPAELVMRSASAGKGFSVRPEAGSRVTFPAGAAEITFERLIPDARRVSEIVPPSPESPGSASRIETRYEPAESPTGTQAVQLDVSMSTGDRYRFWMSTDGRDRLVKLGDDLVIEYVRSVREYRSEVTLIDEDGSSRACTIRVNHPVSHSGRQLFQEGYFPHEGRYASQLAVSRDPGLTFAYVGLTLMTAGVFYACFVKPVIRKRRAAVETASPAGRGFTPLLSPEGLRSPEGSEAEGPG